MSVVGTSQCGFVESHKIVTERSEVLVFGGPLLRNEWDQDTQHFCSVVRVQQGIPRTPKGWTSDVNKCLTIQGVTSFQTGTKKVQKRGNETTYRNISQVKDIFFELGKGGVLIDQTIENQQIWKYGDSL